MDPLSIAASTLTLIEAASKVATALGRFAYSTRTADVGITCLCEELSHLRGLLKAIECTVKGRKTSDLSLVEDGLWHQCEMAMANCQTTLNELNFEVEAIKTTVQHKTFGFKVRNTVPANLQVHDEDLAMYRDKVHQSSLALQTMLHIIAVSLSLRTNASHSQVVSTLDQLKASTHEALHASSRPVGGFHRAANSEAKTDNRITRNLRQLAAGAKSFHSTASSIANAASRSEDSDAQGSILGDFSSPRPLVDQFLDSHGSRQSIQVETVRSNRPSFSYVRTASPLAALTNVSANISGSESDLSVHVFENDGFSDDNEDGEDEGIPDYSVQDNLKELAVASIKNKDYEKAHRFLDEAISRDPKSDHIRSIKLQICLCHILGGNWRQSEPLMQELAKDKTDDELIICNFFHALALGCLSEQLFERAQEYCKVALHGKRRLCNRGRAAWAEYNETLGLHAKIFDMSGDYIQSERFRRRLPLEFKYSHPENEATFILAQKDLLATLLCENQESLAKNDRGENSKSVPAPSQPGSGAVLRQPNANAIRVSGFHPQKSFTLPTKLSQRERDEIDTAKVAVVIDRGESNSDEVSPILDAASFPPTLSQPSPARRNFDGALGPNGLSIHVPGRSVDLPQVSPALQESPTDMSPVKAKWFGGSGVFNVKKSKILHRKKTSSDARIPTLNVTEASPKEGSFNLLRLPKVAHRSRSHSDLGTVNITGASQESSFNLLGMERVSNRARSHSDVGIADANKSSSKEGSFSLLSMQRVTQRARSHSDLGSADATKLSQEGSRIVRRTTTARPHSDLPTADFATKAPKQESSFNLLGVQRVATRARSHSDLGSRDAKEPPKERSFNLLGVQRMTNRPRSNSDLPRSSSWGGETPHQDIMHTTLTVSRDQSPHGSPQYGGAVFGGAVGSQEPEPLNLSRSQVFELEDTSHTSLPGSNKAEPLVRNRTVTSTRLNHPATWPVKQVNTEILVTGPDLEEHEQCPAFVSNNDPLVQPDVPCVSVSHDTETTADDPFELIESSSVVYLERFSELPKTLEVTLSLTTSLLASLNDIQDLESLAAKEKRLTGLFPRLKNHSNDLKFVDDVRRVLFSLRKKVKVQRNSRDDFDYESTSPRTTESLVATPMDKKIQRPMLRIVSPSIPEADWLLSPNSLTDSPPSAHSDHSRSRSDSCISNTLSISHFSDSTSNLPRLSHCSSMMDEDELGLDESPIINVPGVKRESEIQVLKPIDGGSPISLAPLSSDWDWNEWRKMKTIRGRPPTDPLLPFTDLLERWKEDITAVQSQTGRSEQHVGP